MLIGDSLQRATIMKVTFDSICTFSANNPQPVVQELLQSGERTALQNFLYQGGGKSCAHRWATAKDKTPLPQINIQAYLL